MEMFLTVGGWLCALSNACKESFCANFLPKLSRRRFAVAPRIQSVCDSEREPVSVNLAFQTVCPSCSSPGERLPCSWKCRAQVLVGRIVGRKDANSWSKKKSKYDKGPSGSNNKIELKVHK